MKETLITLTINEIRKNLEEGDTEALWVLLESVPLEALCAFLPEGTLGE